MLALTEASRKACGLAPGKIVLIRPMAFSGLKTFHCSATFNVDDYTIATWEPAVSKLESRLAAWSGRKLSFPSKSVIINTLALSQLWHLCHVFPVPKWAEKTYKYCCVYFLLVGQTRPCRPHHCLASSIPGRIWRGKF